MVAYFWLTQQVSPDSHNRVEAAEYHPAGNLDLHNSLSRYSHSLRPLIVVVVHRRCFPSMPRPKRQRPRWLPKWVPFKDGRYLGLAKQTLLAWTSTLLAVGFFCLTVTFAFGSSRLSKSRIFYSSQSNTILVLRIFSEAAGLFLAGTVHSTFEIVQWVLVSRPEGIHFPQFLALQPSTGPLGLIAIALGRGLPPSQWPFPPRLMSMLRLMAEVSIPLLGVLIMSK